MGEEELADSGLIEEDFDVELDSGFCIEEDSELSLVGEVNLGLDKYPERVELDWVVITEHGDSVFSSDEQRDGIVGLRGDGRNQTQDEDKMEAGSGSVEKEESEAERGVEVDDPTEEEEIEGALDVCLRPVNESGDHVRISLEEVERYYRFSCRCQWLCGRCRMYYHDVPSSFFEHLSQNHFSLVAILLLDFCISSVCFCRALPLHQPQCHSVILMPDLSLLFFCSTSPAL